MEQKVKKSVLKNKNFMIFFFGNVVSHIGSMFLQFATGLYILDLTGKAVYMSIYLAISFGIFIVLQPFLGALSDRFNKGKLISRLDYLFGFVELIFVSILFVTNNSTVILTALFINGAITSIISAMYQPTSSSMIPLVAEEEELSGAYSMMSMLNNGQQIIGILLASFLYMLLGFKWLVLIDAITYITAAIFEMFIRIKDEKPAEKEKSHLLNDVKEGFKYMTEKKELINMAKVAVIMNIFLTGVFSVTLPYMINTDLKLDPYVLGMLSAAYSTGGLLMSMYISKKEITDIGRKLAAGFFISVLCFGAMVLTYYGITSVIIGVLTFSVAMGINFFIHGAAGSYIQIPLNIAYAKKVDKEFMGRVMALRFSLSSVATPVAMVGFGLIIDYGGVMAALLIGTVGTLAATLFTRFNKYIKEL